LSESSASESIPGTAPPLYRGRLAPSPTGLLHLGHARTFWIAFERSRTANGVLILRNEDLDPGRAKIEFAQAMIEDLRWLGIYWEEGCDIGGPFAPYNQSERLHIYTALFEKLRELGAIYPCVCSRQDVMRALQAPHQGEEEPVYPGTCRDKPWGEQLRHPKVNWRFRVPDGEPVEFRDRNLGHQRFVAGKDFGDFVVWRHDQIPSYQLAVVADDAAMAVSEVVRGEDLLVSTARQILLYRALGLQPPAFFHCPLLRDENGVRLSKRHDSLSLRQLRLSGIDPRELIGRWRGAAA
jgi:glutamyl-tRNA synthetase